MIPAEGLGRGLGGWQCIQPALWGQLPIPSRDFSAGGGGRVKGEKIPSLAAAQSGQGAALIPGSPRGVCGPPSTLTLTVDLPRFQMVPTVGVLARSL